MQDGHSICYYALNCQALADLTPQPSLVSPSLLIFQLGYLVPIVELDYLIFAPNVAVSDNLHVAICGKVGNIFRRMDRISEPRSCKKVDVGVIAIGTYREEIIDEHNHAPGFQCIRPGLNAARFGE